MLGDNRDPDKDAPCRITSGGQEGDPRDALARVRAEQLREQLANADRLASIGQLAASIAHEIANPLAFLLATDASAVELCSAFTRGVAALAQLARSSSDVSPATLAAVLAETRLSESARALGSIAADRLDAVRRIGALTNDLRGFAGVQEDPSEEVALDDVVRVACRMLLPRIRASGRLVQELALAAPLRGSRTKLIQVVTNLLLNAAHAIEDAPPGAHEVLVTTSRSGDRGMLVVEDSGIGIPAAVAPRVFEPLFTTKRRDRGTGLGLWVVDQIVRTHGGSISFTSRVGHGTRFELYFPLDVSR